MVALYVSHRFDDQIDELLDEHSSDAGLMDALIEELRTDEALLDALLKEVPKWHWNYTPPFEFKKFHEAFKDGRRVYILKLYDEHGHLIDFRVFVGYDSEHDNFYALCIGLRDDCYDPSSSTYRDICSVYDQLSLPPIRGN